MFCDSDAACPTAHCDPFRGCVECLFDHHCSAGERCDDRACSADAAECSTNGDCSGTARCVDSRCEPYTPCKRNADCGDDAVCHLERGECVECLRDADCGDDADRCVGQRCVARCDETADCTGFERERVCAAPGYCAECASHDDCPEVYHCAAGSCVLDVCEPGRTRCDETTSAVRTCSSTGEGEEVTPCGTGESCEGAARCRPWVCQPGAAACSEDGLSIERCSADGLERLLVECAVPRERCVDGDCAPVVCEPGAVTCGDGAVYRCDETGTAEELAEECGSGERCDAGAGACVPLSCVPGTSSCDGTVLTTCREDGAGVEPERDCTDTGEACWDGACRPRVCAETFVCQGSDSYRCDAAGTELTFLETCGAGDSPPRYCDVQSGQCRSQLCTPSEPICVGDVATECRDDGGGPVTLGTNCAARDEACWLGVCLPIVCDGFVCMGTELHACEENGTALRLVDDCAPALFAADTGTCREPPAG